jgi:hypothetical protein
LGKTVQKNYGRFCVIFFKKKKLVICYFFILSSGQSLSFYARSTGKFTGKFIGESSFFDSAVPYLLAPSLHNPTTTATAKHPPFHKSTKKYTNPKRPRAGFGRIWPETPTASLDEPETHAPISLSEMRMIILVIWATHSTL